MSKRKYEKRAYQWISSYQHADCSGYHANDEEVIILKREREAQTKKQSQ